MKDSTPSTGGHNAWSKSIQQSQPPPQPLPLSYPTFNEDEPQVFAEALYQIWARLPDNIQNHITKLVVSVCPKHLGDRLLDCTDSYALLQMICEANNNAIDKTILKQIKALVYSAPLLSITQKRQNLLNSYRTYEPRFTIEQKEMLAGIVGWMLPVKEQFLAPADRVITAAITTGADFDTFQLFIEFVRATLLVTQQKPT